MPEPTLALPQQLLQRLALQPGEPVVVDDNPMARVLGAALLQHEPSSGQLTMRFQPDACFVQGANMLQGGIVCAMLDCVMAFAAFGVIPPGYTVSTANLQTAFLRPAPHGTYTATAEIEHTGKSMVFTRARLCDPQGRVVATGTSTLAVKARAPSTA